MANLITILVFVSMILWIGYEMYTAPHGEETNEGFRITKEGRKLSDLFKKTKK